MVVAVALLLTVVIAFLTQNQSSGQEVDRDTEPRIQYRFMALPTLGGLDSRPIAVTDSGLVVGYSSDGEGRELLFVGHGNKVYPAALGRQQALDIIEQGHLELAGPRKRSDPASRRRVIQTSPDERPQIAGEDGERTELRLVGEAEAYARSGVSALSVDDRVVGWVQRKGKPLERRYEAVYWRSPDAEPVMLGSLGGPGSLARGVNAEGTVVGWARDAERGQSGFVWSQGRMRDLNDLLVSPEREVRVVDASAISPGGLIAGRLVREDSGHSTTCVLVPTNHTIVTRLVLDPSGDGIVDAAELTAVVTKLRESSKSP